MASRSLSAQQVIQVVKRYQKGENSTDIAKDFGVASDTILRWLRKSNVQIRESRVSLAAPINESFFNSIDTELKAYWLGFLLADGCIGESAGTRRTLRLWLAEKDESAIRQFANDINYKGKIRYDGKKRQYGIVFNNTKLCGDLIKHGYLDWKLGNPRIINNVPSNLHYHLVRGLFDGDGSITYSWGHGNKTVRVTPQAGVTIVAHKDHFKCLYEVGVIISASGVNFNGVKSRKTHLSLTWSGNGNASLIHDWMYQNATRYLARKKIKFPGIGIFTKFTNLSNFTASIKPEAGITDDVISEASKLIGMSWGPPSFSDAEVADDLKLVESFDVNKIVKGDEIIAPYRSFGNKLVLKYQPSIWSTRAHNRPSIAEVGNYPNMVKRAVRALLTTGDKITPSRLLRELQFAGFTRASLLPVPTILAVIKKFGLTGRWFDPCAGWGHRLIAAHIAGLQYVGCEPAAHYKGLLSIANYLSNDAIIHNLKWQDVNWPEYDFIMTSPPFYDIEDYGLEKIDESFDEWVDKFICGILDKADGRNVILHVDDKITTKLEMMGRIKQKLRYTAKGVRHKAPDEWIVKL